MEVRPLVESDIDNYFELRLFGLQESPDSFMMDYVQEKEVGADYFREIMVTQGPDNMLFGFYMDERLLGIIGIFRDNWPKVNHRMNIWGMYVHPEFRRNGIGKALLKKSIDHAKKQENIDCVRLSINSANPKAIELYEKFGFVKWGVEPRATRGVNGFLDDVHMNLALGSV